MAGHYADGTCTQDGCGGVGLPTGGKCWAHAVDTDLDPALKRLGEDGRLDARGVPLTAELLSRLLGAVPHDDQGRAVVTDAQFEEATFKEGALFSKVVFQGTARFKKAVFKREAEFNGAIFQGEAEFATGTVGEGAIEIVRSATFKGLALFNRATFQDTAWFGGVTFQRGAEFEEATFQGHAFFNAATFWGDAGFERATFQRDAWFPEATLKRSAGFRGATFQRARQLGPMLVRKSLVLDAAVFHERAQIEVSAEALCCRRARFLAGVQLRVRWAQVVLDDADLAAPSILTGVPDPFSVLDEGRWARAVHRLRAIDTRRGQPRLISVRRADVAGLTVADMDLRACRFVGAHHLDKLHVEESDFASTPTGWRWTPRQTIAEEHHWRAAHQHPNGHDTIPGAAIPSRVTGGAEWYRTVHQPPAWLEVEPPTPAQIATLYRALRKGHEDNKDEPGAADFYYGEMEMRRHNPTKPRAERLVLLLYWLSSGYALRASRALGWLLGVLAVAAVLLAAVGLEPPDAGWSFPARLGTATLVAVEGAVFRASEQQLTYLGRLIQAALRFAGPILLGLAVLSIRGRVKR